MTEAVNGYIGRMHASFLCINFHDVVATVYVSDRDRLERWLLADGGRNEVCTG